MQHAWKSVIGLLALASVLAWASPGSAQLAQSGSKPPPDIRLKSATGLTCKVLGWKADHIENSHVTSWEHGLNTSVVMTTVYFSPGGDDAGVYPVAWNHDKMFSGNPVTIEITRDRVNLHIWSGGPLHGTWNARASGGVGFWTLYSTGFWNVVVCE